MTRNSVFLFLIVFSSQILFAQTQEDWNKAVQIAEKDLVNIEYYEEINSPESISNGNKVKRSLNGVIVDSSGLIITSSSIYRARLDFSGSPQYSASNPPSDIKVRLNSGKILNGTFVGKDDDKNVAFIKTEPFESSKGLKFIENIKPLIGQKVFLIYQLGEQYDLQIAVLQKSVNSVIPGPIKKLLVESLPSDAKFGFVLDLQGNAIGVLQKSKSFNSYQYDYESQRPAFTEILLAESFSGLIKNPPRFKKKETSRKKWLGVNMQPFSRELARYFKVDSLKGILINTILDDSPAKKAGLKSGDVLIGFNDDKLAAEENSDLQYFRNLVREFDGEQVIFKIWRDGKIKKLKIELAEVPISQYLADEVSSELLGFSAKELTKDIILAKQLEFDINGVWISRVERAGWADLSGLQIGDLLLKIDNEDLQNIDQLNSYITKIEKEKPQYINFFIKRRSETRFLFIKTNFN